MPTERQRHYDRLAAQHELLAEHCDDRFREAHKVLAEGYRLMARGEGRKAPDFRRSPAQPEDEALPAGLTMILPRPKLR